MSLPFLRELSIAACIATLTFCAACDEPTPARRCSEGSGHTNDPSGEDGCLPIVGGGPVDAGVDGDLARAVEGDE
jgi:hypothetical protein